jgi:TolB-like protein
VWATTYDRASFTLEAQAEIAESIAAAVTRALQTPSPRAAIR